jgi:hypothetical protein
MGSGFRLRVLTGRPAEVEGGYAGLKGGGGPVPAWGGLVADGARPPQALETQWKHGWPPAWHWRTI